MPPFRDGSVAGLGLDTYQAINLWTFQGLQNKLTTKVIARDAMNHLRQSIGMSDKRSAQRVTNLPVYLTSTSRLTIVLVGVYMVEGPVR